MTQTNNTPPSLEEPEDLAAFMRGCVTRVDKLIQSWIPESPAIAPELNQAMRYAALVGGKRIRPILVYATAITCAGKLNQADAAACAVELIHAYSLTHDDLPAMDNDDLRRGQPTCHKAFGEATAILAGDALQMLAIELLTKHDDATDPIDDNTRIKKIRVLSRASGMHGMVGGQALDLACEGQQTNLEALENIHRHKTGCLIQAAVELGALSAGCEDAQKTRALGEYAKCLGLAFQIQDDVLDVIGDTATTGKQQGADQALQKSTYPDLMGLEQAQASVRALSQRAIDALEPFGVRASTLKALCQYMIVRTH